MRQLWQRFLDWYWHDPIAQERRKIEEAARQYGGSVTWGE